MLKRLFIGVGLALLIAGSTLADHPRTVVCSATPQSDSAMVSSEAPQSDVPQTCETTTGGGGVPASSLLTGLGHYWNLDEASGARSDSLGTAALTDNSTVLSTTGKIGTAATFVAANLEYLSSTDASLNYGNNSFSFAFWLNTTNLPGSVFLSRDHTTSRSYAVDYSGGALRFYTAGGGGAGDLVSVGVPSFNVWHLVVIYYDKANTKLGISVDGAAVTTSTPSSTPPTGVAQFRLGARQFTGAEGYNTASIDEVGTWSRVLTTTEIACLYNGGTGVTYPFTGVCN